MIRLDSVRVERAGVLVLDEVTVELQTDRIAVIGANGSGKSTLARLINGLVSPTSGSIIVQGKTPGTADVGFVFSSPDAQVLMPTVAEDVALSLRGSGLTKDEVRARVDSQLTRFGLHEHRDAAVQTLSGGQKQLLAFAAVLIREPTVLVADEPTTLLDRGNARLIGDLLLDELSMTRMIVTHDLELAARCDEAVLVDGGRIRSFGTAAEVVDEYRSLLTGASSTPSTSAPTSAPRSPP